MFVAHYVNRRVHASHSDVWRLIENEVPKARASTGDDWDIRFAEADVDSNGHVLSRVPPVGRRPFPIHLHDGVWVFGCDCSRLADAQVFAYSARQETWLWWVRGACSESSTLSQAMREACLAACEFVCTEEFGPKGGE